MSALALSLLLPLLPLLLLAAGSDCVVRIVMVTPRHAGGAGGGFWASERQPPAHMTAGRQSAGNLERGCAQVLVPGSGRQALSAQHHGVRKHLC